MVNYFLRLVIYITLLSVGYWAFRKYILGEYVLAGNIISFVWWTFVAINVITLLVGLSFNPTTKTLSKSTKTVNIYSLQDNKDIKGSYTRGFCYGSGSIDEELYYYVLQGDNENDYKMTKYKAESTYLRFESDKTCKPRVEITIGKVKKTFKKGFIFGTLFESFEPKICNEVQKRVLCVPKSAVKVYYNIDLK